MKKKLHSLFRRFVPSQLFILTCALLLILGGICWAAAEKMSRDADAGMRGLTQPTVNPARMVQARR